MKRYLSLFLLCFVLLLAGCSPAVPSYPPAEYLVRRAQCQVKDGRIVQNTISAQGKVADTQQYYYLEYLGVGEGAESSGVLAAATDLKGKDHDRLLKAVMELQAEEAWYTMMHSECFNGEMEIRISASVGKKEEYYVLSLKTGKLIPGDGEVTGEERFGKMVVTINSEDGNIAKTTYIFIAQ